MEEAFDFSKIDWNLFDKYRQKDQIDYSNVNYAELQKMLTAELQGVTEATTTAADRQIQALEKNTEALNNSQNNAIQAAQTQTENLNGGNQQATGAVNLYVMTDSEKLKAKIIAAPDVISKIEQIARKTMNEWISNAALMNA